MFKLFKPMKNQKGSSLIAAIVAMVALGYVGLSVMNVSNTDREAASNETLGLQTHMGANGGIQYALDKVNQGLSPDRDDLELEGVDIDISSDPDTGIITVTSTKGIASKTQYINADFSKDCVELDASHSYYDGTDVKGLELIKTCNAVAIVEKVTVSWNWSSCATSTTCDEAGSSSDETESSASGNGKKTTICHIPPGNPDNRVTLSVGNSAVSAHLAHGDHEGECQTDEYIEGICYEDTDSLDSCAIVTDSAQVTEIDLDNTQLFLGTASAGEEIDTTDYQLIEDTTYIFDNISFDTNVPDGGWYTVTVDFSDGSSLTETFKPGTLYYTDQTTTYEESTADGIIDGSGDGFTVDDGEVSVQANYSISFDILGSAITCGSGGSEIDVRTDFSENFEPYIPLFNNADVDGGESESLTAKTDLTVYKVRARATSYSCANFSKVYNSANTVQVRTLVDGQAAPTISGSNNQAAVSDFLQDYIDSDGYISLSSNQLIMLFEIGQDLSDDPNSTEADFQDLVVLITVSQ